MFQQISFVLLISGSLLAQQPAAPSLRDQIQRCDATDIRCVGSVLLTALEGLRSTPHHRPQGTLPIFCTCDNWKDLRCVTGTGLDERPVMNGNSNALRTSSATACQQLRQIVRIRGRVCDSWNYVYRIDLRTFRYVQEVRLDDQVECLENAQ